jgi:proteasome assembly chaperone (PAC2) family protein
LAELKWPGNHFYYGKNFISNDFILFSGIEPHLRWSHFVDLLLDLAESFKVSQIFTIGGTYDYIPHTYPPMVSALVNDEDLMEKVIQAGLGLTEYTGPISIQTFILETAKKRGLKGISLWGHCPQYLQARNVRVALTVLRKLIDLTRMELDLSKLERASDYFDQQVNRLMEQDPKLQEVIHQLEEVYKRSDRLSPLSKREEGSGEEKVIYMQAFLKKQEDEEK